MSIVLPKGGAADANRRPSGVEFMEDDDIEPGPPINPGDPLWHGHIVLEIMR